MTAAFAATLFSLALLSLPLNVRCETAVPGKDANSGAAARPPIVIGLKSRHPAIDLAGAELAKFLGIMAADRNAAAVNTDPTSRHFTSESETVSAQIELGLFSDFDLSMDGIEDAALDDAIHIDVRESKGVIAGSNPRSVLFAVYRFLEANGCRWIRPGPDGDYVPTRRIDNLSVRLKDKAVYRFRGHNNSGAYSIEYIVSKIEWGAKVGLNTYYNEFLIPKKFFQSWYNRDYPSLRDPEPRTDAEIVAYNQLLNREVKRRGWFLHAAGHGWNAKFFGTPETACDHWGEMTVPEEQTEYLALSKGKRVYRKPTTTELCYGNHKVRERLVRLAADYAETHPQVDYLHFWLDDSMNNTCECELCRHQRVSDFYIMILNALDRELSRRSLPVRIVFLIYQDTLWPPQRERLLNQDRFALMFAPISRLYDEPYELPGKDCVPPPYNLNKNTSPQDSKTNVCFLQAWQDVFQGRCFAYDYHMWLFHFYDPGYYGYLELLAEDIRRLPRLKLDGFVSCQMQRTFFPHGFPHYAHARMLWNPGPNLDVWAKTYFQGAFGEEGASVLAHMKTLSDLFSPEYFYGRGKKKVAPDDPLVQDAREKLSKVRDAVKKFQPTFERNRQIADPVHKISWKHLAVHSGMAVLMADALLARDEGRKDDEAAAWRALRDYIVKHEEDTEGVFDIFSFQRIFPGIK